MNHSEAIYLGFALLVIGAFRFSQPRAAALGAFLGGWVLLPVGNFPAAHGSNEFAYWIVGLALPSEMLISKAWVAPCAALAGLLMMDRQRIRRLKPVACDAAIACLCLWPCVQWVIFGRESDPPAAFASLYLLGSWGATWLLGRLLAADDEGRRLLAQGMAFAAFACLPFSLLEGVHGPFVYDAIYGPHPFRTVGAARYVGFRPVGFFEDGNQFGLWLAMGTIAAAWLACRPQARRRDRWIAATLVVMTIAAQSVGAALLAALGVALVRFGRQINLRYAAVGALALVLLGGVVMLSGRVPLRQIATETTIGRAAVDAFRSVGRESLPWRIAQEQRLLRPALTHPLVGTGQWDWWRAEGRRPWGTVLLMIGQLGIVGLALGAATMIVPAMLTVLRERPPNSPGTAGAPLLFAVIVAMALTDALLNSFVYFPALALAGSLASMRERPQYG